MADSLQLSPHTAVRLLYGSGTRTQTQMQIPNPIRQHAGEIGLACCFVSGVVLIALPLWNDWTWDHGIIVAFGTALFIAPIIAVGIELWMTKSIARDVFRAAFGYGFPEDFKEAIERIASYGVLCTKHIMSVKIRYLNSDYVSVNVTIERHFKNISARGQEVRAFTWVDEWGIPDSPSEITRCELYKAGRLLYDITKAKTVPHSNLSFEMTTPPITLDKHEKCSELLEYTVARRRNDFIYEQFTIPTRNPEIHIIECPPDLEVKADFGGGEMKRTHLPYRYELDGVYFGPAPMKVRWYPKIESGIWLKKFERTEAGDATEK
jgi:hypothetical protein